MANLSRAQGLINFLTEVEKNPEGFHETELFRHMPAYFRRSRQLFKALVDAGVVVRVGQKLKGVKK